VTHYCHAVGCSVPIARRLFFCAKHWDMLPVPLRRRLTAAYREGQEEGRCRPSEEYIAAAREAVDAVGVLEGLRSMNDSLMA
jgi:hypothetical protein